MRLLYCEFWFQYESQTPHSIHVSLNALISFKGTLMKI